MLITFGNYQAKLREWKDKNLLIKYLEDCQRGYFIFGENPDQENLFYSLEVILGDSLSDRFGVGVCSQGHGLMPNVLFLPREMSIVFGFDFTVVVVNVNRKCIIEKIDLDSLFYRFIPIYDQELFLVIQEIGVIAMAESGKVRWRYIKDIVTKARVNNTELLLEFMDSHTVRLNILDGKPIN